MLAVGIVVGLLLAILLVLLLSPLELHLDTTSGDFFVAWRGLGRARLSGDIDDPLLRLWVLGWRKDIHLWEALSAPARKEKEKPEEKKKPPARRPKWLTWRLGLRLLRTFRVRRFRLLLDTGDYVTNAYLFPLFVQLSGGVRHLRIQFDGGNEFVFIVTNRLGKVLWVFLAGILSSKK